MEGSLRNAEEAINVLNSMYLVQEYIGGGNLRKQVLEQVRFLGSRKTSCVTCCECHSALHNDNDSAGYIAIKRVKMRSIKSIH